MLWLILALLVIATIAALLYPLIRSPLANAPARIDYDIVVYRDQLAEIDAEVEDGSLDPSQAAAARAEIHRRMLATEDADLEAPAEPLAETERYSRFVVIVLTAVLVPVAAAVMYITLGSPRLPGQPYAWRVAHDASFADAAMADKLAQDLKSNPTAEGYRRLGAKYFDARNYSAAADADRHAIALGSTDAATWSELGEAETMASNGEVVPDALAAFANALTANPQSERARFYIGLAEAQIGNLKQAVAIWRDLERTSDPAAPWLGLVREHITAFSKQGGFDPESIPPAPPSAENLKAAISAMMGAMKPGAGASATPSPTVPAEPAAGPANNAMIVAMVGRLADRMAKNPNDVDGWLRLAHSYVVLNDKVKARAAVDHVAQLKPRDVTSLLQMADVQRSLAASDDDTAADFIATLRQVLKVDGKNIQALYYVGLAEQKAGHNEVAAKMWQEALAQAPTDEAVAIAIRNRLNGMGKK